MTDAHGAGDADGVTASATAIVLLGAPGAGCSSVGRALARTLGGAVRDLGALTAQRLGTAEATALVSAGEARYRQVEARTALELLTTTAGAVTALGSGCLSDTEVRAALTRAQHEGARTLLLTATTRRLATRNGLDAPRSVALGNVHHAFTQMLRARQELCLQAAGQEAVVIDTTTTTPEQAAAEALARLTGRA